MENPPAPGASPVEGAPPPAATVVSQSPREIELENKLRDAEQARLDAERAAADAEDRAQQLIEIDRRRPAPAPKRKVKIPGPTFFHEETEVEEEGDE